MLENIIRNIIKKINHENKEWEATGYFYKDEFGCPAGYFTKCKQINKSNLEVEIEYWERHNYLYSIWIKKENYFPYLTNKELSIEFYNIRKDRERRKQIEDNLVKDIDKILKKRKKKS